MPASSRPPGGFGLTRGQMPLYNESVLARLFEEEDSVTLVGGQIKHSAPPSLNDTVGHGAYYSRRDGLHQHNCSSLNR
jgi:hypothetical protein